MKTKLKKRLMASLYGLAALGISGALLACSTVHVLGVAADVETYDRQPLTRDYPTSSVVYFLSSSDINAISINGSDFVSPQQAVFTYDNSNVVTTVSQFPVSNFIAVLTSIEWGYTGVTDSPFYCSKATWTYWTSKTLQILNDDSARFAGSLCAFVSYDVVQDGVSKKHMGFYGTPYLEIQPFTGASVTPANTFETASLFAPILSLYSNYPTYRPKPNYLTFKYFSSWLNYNFGTLYAEFASAQVEEAYKAGYSKGSEDGYADGYDVGYAAGDEAGFSRGKSVGYNQGLSAVTDETSTINGLFASLLAVPTSVLNGIADVTIWNVPVISIALTFFIAAVVITIMKRFI